MCFIYVFTVWSNSVLFYLKSKTRRSLWNDVHIRTCVPEAGIKGSKITWWCHQMETFSALLAICAGNSPVRGEFPTQRPMMRSFDFFFDLRPNKRLSKQSWGWWFETLSRPLWRQCNEVITSHTYYGIWLLIPAIDTCSWRTNPHNKAVYSRCIRRYLMYRN